MFGNIPPFFAALNFASILTWIQTQALTLTSTLTINKTAESGAELVARFKTSDAAGGQLDIKNASVTNAYFSPLMEAIGTANDSSLYITAQNDGDGGTSPAILINTKRNGAVITTRPLINFNNHTNTVLSFLPLNSGADLTLKFAGSGVGAPSTAARSIGTKTIWRDTFSAGTQADVATGVESGAYLWNSVATAGTGVGFKFYGGPTLAALIRGDGVIDAVGTLRSTGTAAPSTGTGVEISYSSGGIIGTVQAYDRGASAFRSLEVAGSTLILKSGNTTATTITASAVTMALPVTFKSYTVATLPSAATAGQMIYVSDAAGGAVMAFSNGTNWLRCDTSAIIT